MLVGNYWDGKENAFSRSLRCAVETIFVTAVVCRDEKISEREKSIFRLDYGSGRSITLQMIKFIRRQFTNLNINSA